MAGGGIRTRWPAAVLTLGVLAAARVARAAEPSIAQAAPAAQTLVDERFEEAASIPVFVTYERPPAELAARVERGQRWHLIVEPGSSAGAEVTDGAAVVRIQRAGLHWYAVQLAYLPVRLQPGHAYRVTFRARAERRVVTTFDLAHVGEGWHSYSGQKALTLGDAWQEYEVRFTTGAREAEPGARFEFNFGDEKQVAVSFDDVRIVEEPLRRD